MFQNKKKIVILLPKRMKYYNTAIGFKEIETEVVDKRGISAIYCIYKRFNRRILFYRKIEKQIQIQNKANILQS